MQSANSVFRPAESLLGRFSLAGKILLMGGAFLIVIGLLLMLFLRGEVSALASTKLERSGVATFEPMVEVLRTLQRHRGLKSRLLNGDAGARKAVDEAARMADAAVEAAQVQFADRMAAIGLAGDWAKIRDGWKALSASGGVSATADFAAHVQLISDALALIGRIADATGLTLDAEMDTYYLMDAAVGRLPQIIEAAAQARGAAAGLAAQRSIAMGERIALASRQTYFSENLARLASGLAKVEAVNPARVGGLAHDRGAAIDEGGAFEKLLVDEFIRADAITADPAATFATGTRAVDAGFSLWRAVLAELDRALAQREAAQAARLWAVGCATAVLLALVVYLFAALRRSVSMAAGGIAAAAQRIAGGDLGTELRHAAADEFGSIARSLDEMRSALSAQLESERRSAIENLRIRNALDRTSVNLMLADGDGRIIYMNDSVATMLRSSEADIRKRIPSFAVDTLIGRNFDDFHRNPAHQRGILAGLTGTHVTQIEVGQHTFLLKANPVLAADGKRLGTILEWNDRTAEIAVEKELAELVGGALEGEFGRRIGLEGKEGFFRQLAEGMNRLMAVVAGAIDDVGTVLNAMARGDLTRTIATDYSGSLGQLKDDTNATVAHLREVVARIQESSAAINIAAQEISSGNADLSSRTEEQASSLEETASSMDELNATVRQNAENARLANDLAGESNAVALRGGDMMERVVSTMSSIQESSHKIADIIGVIDSIAFQTNILALNAAVEAARAGEQGRGFAVVASEVRSLAQRSAQAAKEIKGLIDDSVGKVEDGAALVGDAGRTMKEVVSNFQRLAGLVTEIAEASREQSSGIEQVTAAVGQMDEVTQQNSALVEQAAAAAESLQEQAGALVSAAGAFHVDTRQETQSRAAHGGEHQADFDEIILAHMAWKSRLRDYVSDRGESLDSATVERDDECALGCWIHGAGRRFAGDTAYARLRGTHAEFHKCAAKVIRLHDRGDGDGAKRILGDEFARLADETVRAIRALKTHVERGGAASPEVRPRAAVPRAPERRAAAPVTKLGRGALSAAAVHDEWEEF